MTLLTPATRPAKTVLRFITCGSVDDGKSTLIGRLLFETGQIPDDQLASLMRDSRRHGTQGRDTDYALLLDGLMAEREQGITIDVAHRYFATAQRNFIVADTPGHKQYTRNMASGASMADAAILLVDARAGLRPQTRRHSLILSMLRVRHVVLAINKMDLVAYEEAVFERIAAAFHAFTSDLGFTSVSCVPLSARQGDNIVNHSDAMPWYQGPSLLELLETLEPAPVETTSFRMAVQWVNRPDSQFRGYAGTIASGQLSPGMPLKILPSQTTANIDRIVTRDGDLAQAGQGQAVTLTLSEAVDVSRGSLLVAPEDKVAMADGFVARLLWVAEQPLAPGGCYLLKLGTQTVSARLANPSGIYNVDTGLIEMTPEGESTLVLNDIGMVRILVTQPIWLDLYRHSRSLGGFILIDRITNETVAMGLVDAFDDIVMSYDV